MQSGELTPWLRAIPGCFGCLPHEVFRRSSSIVKIKDLAYECVSYGREVSQHSKFIVFCLGSLNTLFLEMTEFYKQWRNLTNALWHNFQHFWYNFFLELN